MSPSTKPPQPDIQLPDSCVCGHRSASHDYRNDTQPGYRHHRRCVGFDHDGYPCKCPKFQLPEPAIPVPDEALAIAEAWDGMFATLVGVPCGVMAEAARAVWLAIVGPRWCDCPMDPHHRWNCPMTPIWAQTMRDLDINPWTAVACGRGPCCLTDGHDGKCRPDIMLAVRDRRRHHRTAWRPTHTAVRDLDTTTEDAPDFPKCPTCNHALIQHADTGRCFHCNGQCGRDR